MSSFNANSQVFNVATENELAVVLSHYSDQFVFTVIKDAIEYRFERVPIVGLPNVVAAWEQNFKAIVAQYGNIEEVNRVRNETYRQIIDIICKEFGLEFTIDDSIDLYSAAYHLYDFLVSNFTNNMVTLFANFIYKERANLYESLNLSNLKKNRDSSTIYGKKIYKDIKLAVINANIDMVISEVCAMDMPLYNIISIVYGNNSELKRYLISIISAGPDFFNKAYVSVLNSDIRPDMITNIRFKLQEIAMSHDQASSDIDVIASNN